MTGSRRLLFPCLAQRFMPTFRIGAEMKLLARYELQGAANPTSAAKRRF